MDPTDLATHGGTGVAAAGIVAGFMRWLAGKEAGEVATKLALLEQKLDALGKVMEKHADLGERVALLEASVKAAHERLDGKRSKR